MKIGILTFHRSTNYGAQLQAYALRRFLSLAGHDASVIDYWSDYRQEREHLFSMSELRELKTTAKLIYIFTRLLTCIRFLKRRNAARYFAENHLNLSKYDSFDVVVYGSDQIWRKFQRTNFKGYDPVYFGQDYVNTYRRITYAASMGPVAFETEADKAFFKKSMQNFDAISVRESGLQTMLAEEFGVTATKVCDPTLLLSADDWSGLIDNRYIPAYPYILYYRLNPNTTADRFVERLSYAKGMKVIEFRGKISMMHYGKRYRLAAGPQEFLSVLSGAKYVVSTSFHGVALSIRLHKQFFFVSKENNANRAMSLLSDLNLQDRRVISPSEYDLEKRIDYDECEMRLQQLVEHSRQWLLKQLNN